MKYKVSLDVNVNEDLFKTWTLDIQCRFLSFSMEANEKVAHLMLIPCPIDNHNPKELQMRGRPSWREQTVFLKEGSPICPAIQLPTT